MDQFLIHRAKIDLHLKRLLRVNDEDNHCLWIRKENSLIVKEKGTHKLVETESMSCSKVYASILFGKPSQGVVLMQAIYKHKSGHGKRAHLILH